MSTLSTNVRVSIQSADERMLHAVVEGDLSWDSHAKLGEELDVAVGFGWKSKAILLDLRRVGFIDSSGISSMLTLNRDVTASGGKLVLCKAPPRILHTFRLVGIHQSIPIASSVEAGRKLLLEA